MRNDIKPINAKLYVRFSDREQAEGASTSRQLRYGRSAANDLTWNVTGELHDRGRSAFTGANRATGAALATYIDEALAGQHQGEGLIVERLDRLSRQGFDDTYALLKMLMEAGVSVATYYPREVYWAGEKLQSHQIMLILMLAERAHEESVTKADRVRDGKAEARAKARAGMTITTQLPPWVTVSKAGKRIADRRRAGLVRQIFQLADGGMGRTKIVHWLHAHGVKPFGYRGSDGWHESFITRLLKNRQVLGEFQPHCSIDGKRVPDGEPISGYFPSIVAADLFERVNSSAPDRKKAMGHRRSEKIPNLMSGLAKCAHCGGTMRYREKYGAGAVKVVARRSYVMEHADARLVCSRAGRNHGCANKTSIAYHTFEKTLLDAILHLCMDDSAFGNRGEVARLNSLIAERERALDLATRKAQKLWDAYGEEDEEDESKSEMAKERAQVAEAQAKELRANVKALKAQCENAKGRADKAAHLLRVEDIRRKLHDPDLEVRVTVRRKVADALASTIHTIRCDSDRAATVVLVGSQVMIKITKGQVTGLDEGDFVGAMHNGLVQLPSRAPEAPLAAVKRRMKAHA